MRNFFSLPSSIHANANGGPQQNAGLSCTVCGVEFSSSPPPSPECLRCANCESSHGVSSTRLTSALSDGVRRLLHVSSDFESPTHSQLFSRAGTSGRSHRSSSSLGRSFSNGLDNPAENHAESQNKRSSNVQTSTDLPPVDSLRHLAVAVDDLLGTLDNPLDEPTRARTFSARDSLVLQLRHSLLCRETILEQFLRARNGSSAAASEMLRKALAWRANIDTPMYLRDYCRLVEHPGACFPLRVLTDPAKGHTQAVVYGLPRLLDKYAIDKTHFINAVISFFEYLYFSASYATESVAVIVDFRGWSLRKNTPYHAFKDGIQLVQDYYPDRLGYVFLLNYPSSIRCAYAVVSPMIDAGPRQKIIWVTSKEPAATLRKHLPLQSLPRFLGGQLDVDFPGVDLAAEWRGTV